MASLSCPATLGLLSLPSEAGITSGMSHLLDMYVGSLDLNFGRLDTWQEL